MSTKLDINVFGTRQTIAYLLGMTQNQRKSKIIAGVRHLLRHQYATFKHGVGVGPLSAAEQASIQAGLAAANGDPEQAAEDRARDLFSDISNAGRAALGPDIFLIDHNDAIAPNPRFAIWLHEAQKIT